MPKAPRGGPRNPNRRHSEQHLPAAPRIAGCTIPERLAADIGRRTVERRGKPRLGFQSHRDRIVSRFGDGQGVKQFGVEIGIVRVRGVAAEAAMFVDQPPQSIDGIRRRGTYIRNEPAFGKCFHGRQSLEIIGVFLLYRLEKRQVSA